MKKLTGCLLYPIIWIYMIFYVGSLAAYYFWCLITVENLSPSSRRIDEYAYQY